MAILKVEWFLAVLNSKIVKSYLLYSHIKSWRVTRQSVVSGGWVLEHRVWPLVPHCSNRGKISKGNIIRRKHSFKLILRNQTVEEVVCELCLLIKVVMGLKNKNIILKSWWMFNLLPCKVWNSQCHQRSKYCDDL